MQIHDIDWPWSLGVACRSLIRVAKTFKLKSTLSPQDNEWATFEGGILLSEHEKGEVGTFIHLVVGKGGSDKKLKYRGYHA